MKIKYNEKEGDKPEETFLLTTKSDYISVALKKHILLTLPYQRRGRIWKTYDLLWVTFSHSCLWRRTGVTGKQQRPVSYALSHWKSTCLSIFPGMNIPICGSPLGLITCNSLHTNSCYSSYSFGFFEKPLASTPKSWESLLLPCLS